MGAGRRMLLCCSVLALLTWAASDLMMGGSGLVLPSSTAPPIAALRLAGCERVFLDAGSNLGEAVDAFTAGRFHGCAMHAPHRVYAQSWLDMSPAARRHAMAPLKRPNTFCVRGFEPAPALWPSLAAKEAELRSKGFDVSFARASLGPNASSTSTPHMLVRYGASEHAEGVTHFRFDHVHAEGPKAREVRAPQTPGSANGGSNRAFPPCRCAPSAGPAMTSWRSCAPRSATAARSWACASTSKAPPRTRAHDPCPC